MRQRTSYNDEMMEYPYDQEQAQNYWPRRGWRTASPPLFGPCLCSARTIRTHCRAAEMIQQDLAEIGVRANIVSYEWSEYLKRSATGEHEMLLLGWTSDHADPDNILGRLLGCQGPAGDAKGATSSPAPASRATPTPARNSIARRCLLFQQEAPWVTMNDWIAFMVVRNRVKNFKFNPLDGVHFYGVNIAE